MLKKIKKQKTKLQKENSEKRKKYDKEYYKKNIKKIKKRKKAYSKKNSEKLSEKSKKYYKENTQKCIERSKKWQKENSERVRQNKKKYRKRNIKKYREWDKVHKTNKKNIDIHFKLKCNISVSICNKLKHRLSSKNGKSTWNFLPYTVDELKQHLEKQFESWMNWDNWGYGEGKWNIDHKKPDSLFNYKSVEDKEFQKCWALENLQPLDAIENMKKGNKIIY